MIDNLYTVYPSSPLLSKYIYCYYIIENTDTNFRSLHYSFPHTFNAVSIYSGGNYFIEKQQIKIIGSAESSSPFTILQGKCQKPLLVDLEGSFSRITILFKSLGINNFINSPLGEIMGSEPSLFTQWNSDSYNQLLQFLFTGNNISSRISELEVFLCLNIKLSDLTLLRKSIQYLSDFIEGKSIEEIAGTIQIPLRTFNRLFKLHLGVSPIMYRQIARFRHSLENKLFNEQFKKLTEIGYNSNFYDQSYFNKLYKQLSGSNPKTFFKVVEQVGDSKLVFQLIKEQTG